eukprot:6260856-Prymnesium_polylepis.2
MLEARRGDRLALRVLRVGLHAELRARHVALGAAHVGAELLAAVAHADHEQPRRQRIERAAVAHLEPRPPAKLVARLPVEALERVADLADDVEAGPVDRLVDDQEAIWQDNAAVRP